MIQQPLLYVDLTKKWSPEARAAAQAARGGGKGGGGGKKGGGGAASGAKGKDDKSVARTVAARTKQGMAASANPAQLGSGEMKVLGDAGFSHKASFKSSMHADGSKVSTSIFSNGKGGKLEIMTETKTHKGAGLAGPRVTHTAFSTSANGKKGTFKSTSLNVGGGSTAALNDVVNSAAKSQAR